jgi:hypothetical protein
MTAFPLPASEPPPQTIHRMNLTLFFSIVVLKVCANVLRCTCRPILIGYPKHFRHLLMLTCSLPMFSGLIPYPSQIPRHLQTKRANVPPETRSAESRRNYGRCCTFVSTPIDLVLHFGAEETPLDHSSEFWLNKYFDKELFYALKWF